MSKSAKSVRPPKREVIVIDDDESTNEQPAEKSVKREDEVVPSAQVVELQKEVLKLKDMFQRACRAARTAELRAEAAENKLDSKIGIKEAAQTEKTRADDFEKKFATISTHFEDLARQADNLRHENTTLTWKNGALKLELDEMKRSTGTNHSEAVNNEQQERVDTLTKFLGVEQRRAEEDRERYRSKIDELKQKLAHYEDLLREEQRHGKKERAGYRERIDELKENLARNEDLVREEQRLGKEDRERYRERMECLTVELEEEKRSAKEDRLGYRAKIGELIAKIDQLEIRASDERVRYQERIAEISSQLDESRRSADIDVTMNATLSRANELLETELAETKKAQRDKVIELTELEQKLARMEDRREEERQAAREDRKCYRTRIDELTHKLAQYERVGKLKPDAQSIQQLQSVAMDKVVARPMQQQTVVSTAACPEASEASKETEMEEGEIDD